MAGQAWQSHGARLPESGKSRNGQSEWTTVRKRRLVARLCAIAEEEERAGEKEIADDFRMRAEIIEQTKSGWPKAR